MSFKDREYFQFDRDLVANKTYVYTTDPRLSSVLARERLTQATMDVLGSLIGKKVIDVGCGDGIYTSKLYEWGKPREMMGVDISSKAIEICRKRYFKKEGKISFARSSCYKLPFESKRFDIAIVRGLIHHINYPYNGLREIMRVSKNLLIIEPNGFNPILKIIEKISFYHRTHRERSYSLKTLKQWVRDLNGTIQNSYYVGLVPVFCPDIMARMLKKLEPIVEKIPFFRNLFCAAYIVKVSAR